LQTGILQSIAKGRTFFWQNVTATNPHTPQNIHLQLHQLLLHSQKPISTTKKLRNQLISDQRVLKNVYCRLVVLILKFLKSGIME